jgi:hypothetical protein
MTTEKNRKNRDRQYSTKEGHARLIFSGVKSRAKKENIICTVTAQEVIANLPDYCPALGIKLSWTQRKGQRGDKDTSPSLDKFDPKLGYVSGNVYWISGLANKIKSNFSQQQIAAVSSWMKVIEDANYQITTPKTHGDSKNSRYGSDPQTTAA